MRAGVNVYHAFRGYAQAAAQHGVVAFELEVLQQPSGPLRFEDLNRQQQDYAQRLREAVAHAFAVRDAQSEEEAQHIVEAERPKIEVCFGPPGTGKTAATYLVIEEVLEQGGYVLFAVYTAQLASRVREKYANHPRRRQLRIDTCHAAFGLDADTADFPLLAEYQLIVIDEVSQLSGAQNDRIIRARNYVDDVPAMAELGDRWQMAGFGVLRPWHSRLWQRAVHATTLVKPYRCLDEQYQGILDMLRTAKPTEAAWGELKRKFLRTNKAWPGDEPDVADVRRLLLDFPQTTMLAVSRQGAALLNELALQAKFPRRLPLATIPGDVDSNPANYDGNGNVKPLRLLQPTALPIHAGLQLYLTKNVQKDRDYINGMKCTVAAWDSERRAVVVVTATGKRIPVTCLHDEDLGGLAYYPLRLGYASTVLKFQGAELEHVVLYLDRPHVPAAAYTAMSRVRLQRDCLVGGRLTPHHFTPAL